MSEQKPQVIECKIVDNMREGLCEAELKRLDERDAYENSPAGRAERKAIEDRQLNEAVAKATHIVAEEVIKKRMSATEVRELFSLEVQRYLIQCAFRTQDVRRDDEPPATNTP